VLQTTSQKYKDSAYVGLGRQQIEKLVYNTRSTQYGTIEETIRNPPLCLANLWTEEAVTDRRKFYQMGATVNLAANEQDEDYAHYHIWGHPDLIHECHDIRKSFIDCTFKVPQGFKQCMIIMIYHPPTQLYVPVFYALLTGN